MRKLSKMKPNKVFFTYIKIDYFRLMKWNQKLYFLLFFFIGVLSNVYCQDIRTKGTFDKNEETTTPVKKATLTGEVIEVDKEKGIANVKVQLVDLNRNLIIEKTKTSSNGHFTLYQPIKENYMIYIEYEGMPPLMVPLEPSDKSIKILKVETSWSWVKN